MQNIKPDNQSKNPLVNMVEGYHGKAYTREQLEALSNERLLAMIHPSDREYLADQAKQAAKSE